ncbi:DUF5067 domain-containing protein [Facklamia sp. P9177]|uniref:DUF5067 domain-containing protein n=1 Tax=unclassified Facklamia TaxID=2622293 RepID=UPI003D162B47
MKKILLTITCSFLLSGAPVYAEENPDQERIDELLTELQEINMEANKLQEEMMKKLEPLNERVSEINEELKDLGYNKQLYETPNALYNIREMYVVDNAMFPDKKVLVIDMEFTNKTKNPVSPWMAFVGDFTAQQQSGATVEVLLGANGQLANAKDQESVAIGDKDVLPNKTVKASIGYVLFEPSAQVQFILNSSKLTGNPQGFTYDPK